MSDPWRPPSGPAPGGLARAPDPGGSALGGSALGRSALSALIVYVALQLPGALIWAVELATRQTPALGFPGWTPPSTAWAYDSWVWSTTAAAGLFAGLTARRPAGASLGVALGVLLGAVRYPFLVAVGRADTFRAEQVVVGVLITLVVALVTALLGAVGSRVWWSRLLVVAACLPAVMDQTRLLDVWTMALGRPNPTLPPSATWVTPAVVAAGVAVVLAGSGLPWFGARARWPLSLAVAAGSVLVALFVLAPARFLLLDAAQAWLPREFGGGTLRFGGVPWTFVPSLLERYWWMFLLAGVIGVGLAALLRLVGQWLLADEGRMGASGGPHEGEAVSA